MPAADWIKLVALTSPHGVKGSLKAKSFTNPPNAFADYPELTDENGTKVSLRIIGGTGDAPIVTIEGVTSRDDAERWRGKTLGVAREQLKAISKPDTHYVADLVGITAVDEKGATLGTIASVMNFGAGDILEISFNDGSSEMFSYTKRNFPTLDTAARRITMTPPHVIGSRAEEGSDEV